ncbi:hypothetical protein [Segatella salivae]|uniref:hypothetical protein n=1 Tax=Segatella salivae TaxID=228604 RepID=UPI0028E19271|nr:hypothetical protein [Segatella salivae]
MKTIILIELFLFAKIVKMLETKGVFSIKKAANDRKNYLLSVPKLPAITNKNEMNHRLISFTYGFIQNHIIFFLKKNCQVKASIKGCDAPYFMTPSPAH